jgi:hypothetical protein
LYKINSSRVKIVTAKDASVQTERVILPGLNHGPNNIIQQWIFSRDSGYHIYM